MSDEDFKATDQTGWGWIMAAGILVTVFGFIGLSMEVAFTFAGTILLGAFVFVGGVAQFIAISKVESWGSRFSFLLLSFVYIIAGLVTMIYPAMTAVWITAFIALSLIVVGIFRIGGGMSAKRYASSWGWIVLSGAISILLGILIWMSWPSDSLWVIGLFVAVEMIFQGVSLINMASIAKSSLNKT